LLFQGLHVWTADTGTLEAREHWLAALDHFDSLNPELVVAGHRVAGATTSSAAIEHTRTYLRRFNEVIVTSETAADAEATLRAEYPDAGLDVAVSLGTKVAKGEMSWG